MKTTLLYNLLTWTNKLSGQILNEAPKIIGAVVILFLGIYISWFVRRATRKVFSSFGMTGSKNFGSIVLGIFILAVVITALEQAGLDLKIFSYTIIIAFGAIILAFAVSYGLATKDIVKNILAIYQNRLTITAGKVISINNIKGEIISINKISTSLKTDDGKIIIIPTQKLFSEEIHILEE